MFNYRNNKEHSLTVKLKTPNFTFSVRNRVLLVSIYFKFVSLMVKRFVDNEVTVGSSPIRINLALIDY
jgi:hypothetical protein